MRERRGRAGNNKGQHDLSRSTSIGTPTVHVPCPVAAISLLPWMMLVPVV